MNNQTQVPAYLQVKSQDIINKYRDQVNNMLYNEMVMQQQMAQMQKTIDDQHELLKKHGIDSSSDTDNSKQQDVELNK